MSTLSGRPDRYVVREMLWFIYTGRSASLDKMADRSVSREQVEFSGHQIRHT
jgi:hypothetical protein